VRRDRAGRVTSSTARGSTFFPSLRDTLSAIAILAGTLAVLVFLIVLSRRARE
jgi:hypothetical protein